jgi:hypothetical protein
MRETVVAYLDIFEAVLLANTPQDVLFAAFLHLPRQQELIENKVCLLEVKDDVQLAHVAIVFIHLFHVAVDDLEADQLVVRGGASCNEK